jgi:type II restriction enzyme
VKLELPAHLAAGYHSKSQQARVVTESWAARELFCAACVNDLLNAFGNNNAASDFQCCDCFERYQLKSQSRPFATRVLGANYRRMCQAIAEETAPSYFLLHYSRANWTVQNLTLIPHRSVTVSALVRRPPLRATARRANWEGYTLNLDLVPEAAKIIVIRDGIERSRPVVRSEYAKIAPILALQLKTRGWTLDVERLNSSLFSTQAVYAFAGELAERYPDNRHIIPKIRQQLQVLRDAGIIQHLKRGFWQKNTTN